MSLHIICNVFFLCLWTSTFLNTGRYFCMNQWIEGLNVAELYSLIIHCSIIPPSHWHPPTGESEKQNKQWKERMPQSQKDIYWEITDFIENWDMTRIKATRRKGAGRANSTYEVFLCTKAIRVLSFWLMICYFCVWKENQYFWFSWVLLAPGLSWVKKIILSDWVGFNARADPHRLSIIADQWPTVIMERNQ